MVKINVLESFVLTEANGTRRVFERGVQRVEDRVAEHWYTKAHSERVTVGKARKPGVNNVKAED